MHPEYGFNSDMEYVEYWVVDDFWNEQDFIKSYNVYDDYTIYYDDWIDYDLGVDIQAVESSAYLKRVNRRKIERLTGKCNHCGIHRGCNSTNKSRHSDIRKTHKKWSR